MNLVTGATGHIGNVLVRTLLEKGQKVRALVLPGEDITPIQNPDVEIIEGDILDPQLLHEAFKGVQDVYHLAGIISIMPGKNALVQKVNIQGTRNVIEAAWQSDIRRLIYTSSIHALHRAPHGVTIDESIPFDPIYAISAYDQSKAYASLAVQEAARQGLEATIVSPTGVIGPFDYRRSEMGQIILDSMQNKLILCVKGVYDFVDVRDVAEGLVLAAQKGRRGENYILSGEQISLSNIIETVRRSLSIRATLFELPMDLARFLSRFAPMYYRLTRTKPRFTPYALETIASNSDICSSKARRELGFRPRSLVESITDTVKWFLEDHQLALQRVRRG